MLLTLFDEQFIASIDAKSPAKCHSRFSLRGANGIGRDGLEEFAYMQ
ncbi:hypothetical protein [Vreelandella aquamarina]